VPAKLTPTLGDQTEPVTGRATFTEVANQCGATGSITMRQAAERDGLQWPESAAASLVAYHPRI